MKKSYEDNPQKMTSRKEQELYALGFVIQKIIDEATDTQKEILETEISVLKDFYSPMEWELVEEARGRYGTVTQESEEK